MKINENRVFILYFFFSFIDLGCVDTNINSVFFSYQSLVFNGYLDGHRLSLRRILIGTYIITVSLPGTVCTTKSSFLF